MQLRSASGAGWGAGGGGGWRAFYRCEESQCLGLQRATFGDLVLAEAR